MDISQISLKRTFSGESTNSRRRTRQMYSSSQTNRQQQRHQQGQLQRQRTRSPSSRPSSSSTSTSTSSPPKEHPCLNNILIMLAFVSFFLLTGYNNQAGILSVVVLVTDLNTAPTDFNDPTVGMISMFSFVAGLGCAALLNYKDSFLDRLLGHSLGRLWALGMAHYLHKQYEEQQQQQQQQQQQHNVHETKRSSCSNGSNSTNQKQDTRPVQIKITVLEGRNLVAKDTSMLGTPTTSDPYVIVQHGSHILGKTTTVYQTLDPKWIPSHAPLEEMISPVALGMNRYMHLLIFDYDTLASDDPMGMVHLFLPNNVQTTTQFTKWYPVEVGSGNHYCDDAQGELLVKVEIKSQDDTDKVQMQQHRQLESESAHQNDSTFVKIQVKIMAGKDLVVKDFHIMGKGSSDPFVVVHFADQRIGKTKVVKKTLNPIWKERNEFDVIVPMSQVQSYRYLELQLFDHDLMSSNDPMGTVYLPLLFGDIMTTTDESESTTVTQTNNNDNNCESSGLVNHNNNNNNNNNTLQWYPVEKGQGSTFCSDAKGFLQVQYQVVPVQQQQQHSACFK